LLLDNFAPLDVDDEPLGLPRQEHRDLQAAVVLPVVDNLLPLLDHVGRCQLEQDVSQLHGSVDFLYERGLLNNLLEQMQVLHGPRAKGHRVDKIAVGQPRHNNSIKKGLAFACGKGQRRQEAFGYSSGEAIDGEVQHGGQVVPVDGGLDGIRDQDPVRAGAPEEFARGDAGRGERHRPLAHTQDQYPPLDVLVQVGRVQANNLLFQGRQVHGWQDVPGRQEQPADFFDAGVPPVVDLRQHGIIFPSQVLAQEQDLDHLLHRLCDVDVVLARGAHPSGPRTVVALDVSIQGRIVRGEREFVLQQGGYDHLGTAAAAAEHPTAEAAMVLPCKKGKQDATGIAGADVGIIDPFSDPGDHVGFFWSKQKKMLFLTLRYFVYGLTLDAFVHGYQVSNTGGRKVVDVKKKTKKSPTIFLGKNAVQRYFQTIVYHEANHEYLHRFLRVAHKQSHRY
jgi:hypothetical protein